MNLAREVRTLRSFAVFRGALNSLAAERERKAKLAARLSPELRRSELLRAFATRRERQAPRVEVSQTSVRRMAQILKAIDQARARGIPLSAVFKVRK